jgi:predicted  nucleic acid-binding Zn-ribbon protein
MSVVTRIRLGEFADNPETSAILPAGRAKMNQSNEEAAAQLKREHEAAKQKLESLREEARKLGHEFEEKLKPEILEAEVELTRLSGMLGQIGL